MKLLLLISLLCLFSTLKGENVLNLVDQVVEYDELINYEVTLDGKSSLHLTGDIASVSGSSFDILSEDSWIYFHAILPSDVDSQLSAQIFVDGNPAIVNQNIRFEIYRHGTAVIPHGPDYLPLTVFSEQGLTGDSTQLDLYTYHRAEQLGAFHEQISSFRLKKGYKATFAQGELGEGYSRVFIAQDDDLLVEAMPAGLDNEVSFVRVFKWKYPSKKGWGGGGLTPPWEQMRFTWYYNWNANSQSEPDYEFIPIRHNYYWPSWDLINNIENTTQLLGYNEPERPDQADMTVDQAIGQWPKLMESGLRLGSPSPSDSGRPWLYEFMQRADELNYRVDYVSMHWYEGCRTPLQFYNRLRSVHEETGRPIWVKEFNNGANWTSGCHPTWEENAAWFAEVLPMLDTAQFVERYAVFHYMQEPFRMIHNGELTPAGEVYKNHEAELAFNPDYAFYKDYITVTPPYLVNAGITVDGVKLEWQDNLSGSKNVRIQRSFDGAVFDDLAFLENPDVNSFLDLDDLEGDVFYRLRHEAEEGNSVWSTTTSVFLASHNPYTIDHNSSGYRLRYEEGNNSVVLVPATPGSVHEHWQLIHSAVGLYYIENIAGQVRLAHDTNDGIHLVSNTNTSNNARWEIERMNPNEQWRFLINRATGRKLHASAGTDFTVDTTEPQWTGPNVQWKLTETESETNITHLPLSERVAVYPNPSDGYYFKVKLNHTHTDHLTVEVYDSFGRFIQRKEMPAEDTSLKIYPSDRLAPGLYLIRVQSGQMVSKHKMIVMH